MTILLLDTFVFPCGFLYQVSTVNSFQRRTAGTIQFFYGKTTKKLTLTISPLRRSPQFLKSFHSIFQGWYYFVLMFSYFILDSRSCFVNRENVIFQLSHFFFGRRQPCSRFIEFGGGRALRTVQFFFRFLQGFFFFASCGGKPTCSQKVLTRR